MAKVFSGIQPTGVIHIGNYLGAIKNWVEMQNEHEAIFCIVDLHAITIPQEPAKLKQAILENAALYLACGIDPEQSTLFVQSQRPEHAQLAWLLNSIASVGELNRMTQYKEKGEGRESVSAGLFDYPVLMAADILLYQTDLVPVGEDQKQHVELARNLSQRFNSRFGEAFTMPEPMIGSGAPTHNATHSAAGGRIMGLDDPTKKMSKSAASEYNYIALTDDAQTIRLKIQKAVTDSGSEIKAGEGRPALTNLLTIYSLFSGQAIAEIEAEFEGKGYSDFKTKLADVIIEKLTPIQEKQKELLADPEKLESILQSGAEKIAPVAESTLKTALEKMGLR